MSETRIHRPDLDIFPCFRLIGSCSSVLVSASAYLALKTRLAASAAVNVVGLEAAALAALMDLLNLWIHAKTLDTASPKSDP